MATLTLKVLTSEREFFAGEVDRFVVRTTAGDVGILPGHIAYTAALGIGKLIITQGGKAREAAAAGGFVEVSGGQATILARSCEWADEIDVARAESAAERAKQRISAKKDAVDTDLAEIKLKRALNRIRIAKK